MFYGSDTKFSYTAAQWIEVEPVKISKHICYKICGHGVCRAKVQVLDHQGKKHLNISQLMTMNLRPT